VDIARQGVTAADGPFRYPPGKRGNAMAKRLTTLSIENMKPGPVRREIPDGKGLYLVLQPSGAKSWAVRPPRVNGKTVKITLGSWPALSLLAARKAAADALCELAEGRDPREAKKTAKAKAEAAAADTVRAVADMYMRLDGKKLRSVAHRQRVLDRLVYPALGGKQIDTLKRSEIVRLLDKIETENGARMAHMVLAVLSRIFNWYAARSDEFRSPIVRGMGRVDAAARARKRILTDDELRTIWRASKSDEGPFGALVRFLLLTGARRTEAAGLQRDEVDSAGTWTLPEGRNKSKVELVRPLSKAAGVILDQQPHLGPFVFTCTGRRPLTGISEFKQELDAACGVTGWTLHDLRRTARSLMSRAGVSVDHAERCLGHVIGGVRGTYDRHQYQKEMLAAYEALAALIERIVHPQENVVALKR
jgi:integrase